MCIRDSTLSEENKKIYQSYDCGLCQTMKSQYGRRAQMALNYDMTFLIVLLTGLYEPDSVCLLYTSDVLAASHELLSALRTGNTDLAMSSWHPDLLLAHRALEELVLLPLCKACLLYTSRCV